jgi:hypothetical protein
MSSCIFVQQTKSTEQSPSETCVLLTVKRLITVRYLFCKRALLDYNLSNFKSDYTVKCYRLTIRVKNMPKLAFTFVFHS